MARLKLTKDLIDAAVLGGCVLGGGGGGSMEEGRQIANIALSLSSVELVDIEDMNDDNILINVSAVGQFYKNFAQVSGEEVMEILNKYISPSPDMA